MTQNPLAAYKETRIRTAGPGQLVVMLYEEAVKQCDRAVDFLDTDLKKKPANIEKVNQAICKVQDIVTELMASLDFEAGGDIARDLFSLYVYFNRELTEANIAKDVGRVRAIRRCWPSCHRPGPSRPPRPRARATSGAPAST